MTVVLADGSTATGIVRTNSPVTVDILPEPLGRALEIVNGAIRLAGGGAPMVRQVDQFTGRIAALECECATLRQQCADMTAARDHAREECRATARALALSHDVRNELDGECDRLTAELDAAREENARLHAELDERTAELREQQRVPRGWGAGS